MFAIHGCGGHVGHVTRKNFIHIEFGYILPSDCPVILEKLFESVNG